MRGGTFDSNCLPRSVCSAVAVDHHGLVVASMIRPAGPTSQCVFRPDLVRSGCFASSVALWLLGIRVAVALAHPPPTQVIPAFFCLTWFVQGFTVGWVLLVLSTTSCIFWHRGFRQFVYECLICPFFGRDPTFWRDKTCIDQYNFRETSSHACECHVVQSGAR